MQNHFKSSSEFIRLNILKILPTSIDLSSVSVSNVVYKVKKRRFNHNHIFISGKLPEVIPRSRQKASALNVNKCKVLFCLIFQKKYNDFKDNGHEGTQRGCLRY